MKTVIGSLATAAALISIFITSHATAQTCTPPPENLVSWWPADGNADDIQDGNNGTLQDGASFAPGKVDQAFNLDGGNDRIDVADNANLNPGLGSFSVETWVFETSPHAGLQGPIVAKHVGDFQNGYLFSVGTTNAIGAGVSDVSGNQLFTSTGVNMPLNVWAHLAMTYDSSTKTLNVYKDGLLIGSASNPTLGSINPTGRIFRIGSYLHHDTTVPTTFPGRIDEVSYYNRALTPVEILAIFNADSAGKCKPGASDLAVEKSDAPDPVLAGDKLVYTVDVSNNGTSEATGATLTDTLPAEVTFVSANSSQGTCSPGPSNTVTCDLGTLATEATATVEIVVTATTTPGTIVNSVEVTSNETDADETNNSAAEETTVVAVTCDGQPVTIVGTPGNDVINGTPGRDVIHGLSGNDTINGRNAGDSVCGGNDNDTISGDNDADRLFGEAGDDRLNGNNGTDALDGGAGMDICNGGSGADTAASCEAVSGVP